MSGKHKPGTRQGHTIAMKRETITRLLRSGFFKSPEQLAQYMASNALQHPENVDRIHIRASRLNRSSLEEE
jgi:dihydroneopterin aldolase